MQNRGGMPSVSVLYADALGAFLHERGLPWQRPAPNVAPARRVVAASFAHSLYGGERELGDPSLGLHFGTRVGAAGFGMLGIAAATAPTLGESIRQLTQLESLTSTLGRAQVRRVGRAVQLRWRPAQPVPPMVIEGILSGWVSFGRYLLGERVEVAQVALAHPRRAPVQAYDETFESPVRFGAGCYGVTFGADLMAAPTRFADPTLNASLNTWLDSCAAAIATEHRTLARTITAMLGQQLPLADADELTTARLLGLGRRTLQRLLQAEGTSFRQVLNAARAQHAVLSLLHGQPGLSDLGAAIGFEEQSSLCRGFRRWTGYAPLEFKRRMDGIYASLRAQ
jgi:AraC-like DNA-binding protein